MGETRTCSNYPSRLLGSLRQMRGEELLTDLTIMIGEDEVVYNVHKCVMVAASKHFAALVHAEQLNDSHCLIKGVEDDHWATLLDFIYSGQLDLTADNCLPLHSTAQQLGIDEAEKLCDEYIKDNNFEISDEESDVIEDIKQEVEDEEPVAEGDTRTRLPSPVPLESEATTPLKEEPRKHTPVKGSVKRSMRTRRKPRHFMEDEEDEEDVNTPKHQPKQEPDMVEDEDMDPDWGEEDLPNRKRKTEEGLTLGEDDISLSDDEIQLESVSARKKRRFTRQSKSSSTNGSKNSAERSKMNKFMDYVIRMDAKGAQLKDTGVRAFRRKKKSFGFVKYGKLMERWRDDSMAVKDLPQFKCKRCQYRFLHAAALVLHARHKHGMLYSSVRIARRLHGAVRTVRCKNALVRRRGVFKCSLCDQRFDTRSRAVSHLKLRHYALHTVRCTRCDAILNEGCRNRSHRCSGSKPGPTVPRVLFCRHCPRMYKHSKALEGHYEEEHPEENFDIDMVADVGFECRHCKRTFVRLPAYLVHLFGHGLNDKEVDLEFTDPSRVPVRCQVSSEPSGDTSMPYKCPDCEFSFAKKHRLDVHMMNKHNKRLAMYATRIRQTHRVYCSEDGCDKVFSRMPDLRKHVSENHHHVQYDCAACDYSTNIKAKYENHMKVRHSADVADRTCPHCKRVFDKKQRLKIHLHAHHGIDDPSVRVWRCDHPGCSYETYTRFSIELHRKKHMEKKSHKCETCGKMFKTLRGLKQHVDNLHLGIKPFVCDICGTAYGEENGLKKHLLRHTDTKQYQCDLCDYASHDKGNFQSHMFSKHERYKDNPGTTGSRKVWTCDICGYRCNLKHRVQEHMDSHNNVRRHKCHICGQTFIARYSLNYHMKKVHDGITYDCKECTFKAPTASKLNFHMRTKHTHVGVKPFKCYYCDFHSANSGNVNKHVKKKHPGMKYKWVKVGTFETLPPHHDLKHAGISPAPIAVRESQTFLRESLINQDLIQGVSVKESLAIQAAVSQAVAGSNEQFYLMTEYENGQPVVKLLSQEQLDTLNAKIDPTAMATETEAAVPDQAAAEQLQFDPAQLQLAEAAGMQLHDDQLQVLDEHKEGMQVIYVPPDMMEGTTLVIEDPDMATQAGQAYAVHTSQG